MRELQIILMFFLVTGTAVSKVNSQNTRLDSLENLLQKHIKEDTLRVNLLNGIALEIGSSDTEESFNYAKQANRLADKISFKKGKIESLEIIGLYYYNIHDYQTSIKYYTKAAQNYRNISLDKEALALFYIARCYKKMGKYDKAIEYYQKSYEKYIENGDKKNASKLLNNIAHTYYIQGFYPEALIWYQETLKMRYEIEDKKLITSTLNQIGVVYHRQGLYEKSLEYIYKALKFNLEIKNDVGISKDYNNLGVVYMEKEDFSKATEYYKKSLEIDIKLNDKIGISISLNNIGYAYLKQEKYSKSLDYLLKSIKLKKELGRKRDLCSSYVNLAELYFETQKYKKALEISNKALEISNSMKLLYLQNKIYKQLAKIYANTNNYKKAYNSHVMYKRLNDSIYNEKNIRKITTLELTYKFEKEQQLIEFEQQAKEISHKKEIKYQKLLNIIFIIILILILFLTLYIYYNLKQKQKSNMILFEQKNEIQTQNEEISSQNDSLINSNYALDDTIKKLKQTKKQLMQADKMASLGVLTAGIAHELNNPINFVFAGVNSVLKDFKDVDKVLNPINKLSSETESINEEINKILKIKQDVSFNDAYSAIKETLIDVKIGAERTSEIVIGLRDFSGADTGQWILSDIHELIDASLIILKNKFKNRIKLIKEYSNDLDKINCISVKLKQVFFNIINNAIDAIQENGTIKITTKKNNKKLIISIEDNGEGMSEDITQKIFDPFFTTKDIGKGTGLGLSISYGIIEEHKGDIEILSEKGEGTEFIISLPIK